MKTKTLNELYVLLYEQIQNKYHFYICNQIDVLLSKGIITETEHDFFLIHFESQRPTLELHTEFYDLECYNKTSVVWFSDFLDNATENRIKFIQKLIEITK